MTTDAFFKPVSGFDLPRFAGVPTFMRLPHVPFDHPRFGEVQIGLIGAPWDGGTTNRPGPRHGPRQLRDLSTMIRAQNGATWVAPFDLARCADLGDVGALARACGPRQSQGIDVHQSPLAWFCGGGNRSG